MMILLFHVRQPQEGPIARRKRRQFPRDRLIERRADCGLRLSPQAREPGGLALRATPPIGHQVACDPEYVTPQFVIVEPADVRTKEPAEGVLHDVVRIGWAARHTIHVGPQRARRALIETAEVELIQRNTLRGTRDVGWPGVVRPSVDETQTLRHFERHEP